MSRIGRTPVVKPEGVSLEFNDRKLVVKGELGSTEINLPKNILLSINNNILHVSISDKSKKSLAFWGLYRALINNAVIGVSKGFEKRLELVGVGYRATLESEGVLSLKLGYSHIINYKVPNYIEVKCLKPTLISLFGISKQQVNQVAAEIRALRKPEPYKGKGVRYEDEVILLKEGKRK